MKKKLRAVISICCVVVFAGLLIFFLWSFNQATSVQTDGGGTGFDAPDEIPSVFSYAIDGDVESVSREIENGVSINIRHPINGRTLLHFAIEHGHNELVDYLVEAGAGLDDIDNYGTSPVMLAVYNGNEYVYTLLKDKVNLFILDDYGNTLLHLAASSGNLNIASSLVDEGIDVFQKNDAGNEALYYASSRKMLGALMDYMGLQSLTAPMAKNLLFTVVSPEVLDYLLETGLVDINTVDDETTGYNALYYAMTNGCIEVFNRLIQKGIDINHQDAEGNTVLLHCAYDGYTEYAAVLLDNNADVSIRNKEGQAAEEIAEKYGNTDVHSLLSGE